MPGGFAHDGAVGIRQIGLLVRPWRRIVIIILAGRLFQPFGGCIKLVFQALAPRNLFRQTKTIALAGCIGPFGSAHKIGNVVFQLSA